MPLHEYSKRGSTKWRKDFDKQDIMDAMNHKEIKDKLFDGSAYVLVEVFLVSIPKYRDGRKYLASFDIEVYGATPKNGLKIYLC